MVKRRFWIRVTCAGLVLAALFAAAVPVWRGYIRTRDVQEGMPFRGKFVTAYGLCRRLTGARSCNGCVRLLGSGQLMMPSAKRREMALEASKAAAFSAFCRTNGVGYLFVQLPKKLDVPMKMLPPGVKDFAYANADDLLRRLAVLGVETLDWRARFAASPRLVTENFYTSDSHWTNPASLRAAHDLAVEIARRCGDDVRGAERLADANWERSVLKGFFSGSLGKRTGMRFADSDDVTVLIPKFATGLELSVPDREVVKTGSFAEIALPGYVKTDAARRTRNLPFSAHYAGGGARFVRLVNPEAPIGRKILLIGDSFSRSLRTYLWTVVREIVAVDPRQYDPAFDCAGFVRDERPDLVIQIPTAAALTSDVRTGEKRGYPAAFDYGL